VASISPWWAKYPDCKESLLAVSNLEQTAALSSAVWSQIFRQIKLSGGVISLYGLYGTGIRYSVTLDDASHKLPGPLKPNKKSNKPCTCVFYSLYIYVCLFINLFIFKFIYLYLYLYSYLYLYLYIDREREVYWYWKFLFFFLRVAPAKNKTYI
jgi:hypothetical protein